MRNIYEHINDSGYSHVKNEVIFNDRTSFIPLLLIAPRIPFPPMDCFLGIDFIICNFLNKKDYQKLQTEPPYKRVIKKSQEKLWKPYFNIMAQNWEKNIGSNLAITPHMLNQMLLR